MNKNYKFFTSVSDAGERIDVYLAKKLSDELSRSRIQSLIKEGYVKVNNNKVKASTKIKGDCKIIVEVPPAKIPSLTAQDIPVDIIYEDKDIVVTNKPHGMVVHPAHGNPDKTLVNAIMYRCPDIHGISGTLRPGIVHRLDKDTSGVIVICKNDHAHKILSEQFKNHTIKKEYLAILLSYDRKLPDCGKIKTLIGRSKKHRKKFSTKVNEGRESMTEFEVIARSALATLVVARPITGRTHQIRVHFSDYGCPILGDKIYGKGYPSVSSRPQEEARILRTIKRQALHAYKITFIHPTTNNEVTFTTTVPGDMDYIIRKLFLKLNLC